MVAKGKKNDDKSALKRKCKSWRKEDQFIEVWFVHSLSGILLSWNMLEGDEKTVNLVPRLHLSKESCSPPPPWTLQSFGRCLWTLPWNRSMVLSYLNSHPALCQPPSLAFGKDSQLQNGQREDFRVRRANEKQRILCSWLEKQIWLCLIGLILQMVAKSEEVSILQRSGLKFYCCLWYGHCHCLFIYSAPL